MEFNYKNLTSIHIITKHDIKVFNRFNKGIISCCDNRQTAPTTMITLLFYKLFSKTFPRFEYLEQKFEFLKPVFPKDIITIQALNSEHKNNTYEFITLAFNHWGEKVLRGSVKLFIPEEI